MPTTPDPNAPDIADLTGLGAAVSATVLRQRLRDRLAADRPLVLPGVTDAMGFRLVAQAGFDAAYATGGGVANASFGIPDVGLITMSETVEQVGRLTASGALPLVVDGDTGYGGPLAAMRTVHLLERAGAAAIQLEDQESPKRCGHFDDHQLIPAEHMQAKLEAAINARSDDGLVIIARTDARSVYDIDEAIRRAHAYREAGADVLFVEAPRTIEELARVGRELAGVPLVVNVVEGGKTPQLTVAEYYELGFSIVLYANFLMRNLIFAGRSALAHLYEHGETTSLADRMVAWDERQNMFGLPAFTAAQRYYDSPTMDSPKG
jgi:2,3-dimethylmalate lyase